MVSSQLHYTKVNRFMPFLLAEILNFQGSTHRIGVGSFSYIVRHIKIGGIAVKTMSDYGMGIYLYAEPLNYLFLFLFYHYLGIEYFGSEFGAAVIYFSRIIITPIIAMGITWVLKRLNLKYLY